jgi:hypothetical protein
MGSLFQGSPQTATSYTTSSTETPTWMQDAIYNQIQVAQNIANRPFESYDLPTVAELSPLQQQAYQQVQDNQGNWQPGMNFAQSGMEGLSSKGTVGALGTAQNQYLRQNAVDQGLNAGQNFYNKAGGMDVVAAAQPYMNQAGQTTAQALSDRALNAASPYLQSAAGSAAGGINQYMSPYQSGVMDVIARQGARNLTENLLPGVSDSFIKAGQFGSRGMGEFGNRALRDTQEAILNQQSQLANQGYGQALNASQADLARQAQLAGTVGSISGADLSRVLQGGAQYGNLGQTQGQLTGQQMSQLGALGQMQTGAGQAQQQYGLSAAQAAQQAQAQDYSRQMSALSNISGMAQQQQQMGYTDSAALEAAGQMQQQQAQSQLTSAQQQFQNEQLYPQQNMDWLNTQIRGMAPITPQTQTQTGSSSGATYSPSPLSQLASGMFTYKGLTAG